MLGIDLVLVHEDHLTPEPQDTSGLKSVIRSGNPKPSTSTQPQPSSATTDVPVAPPDMADSFFDGNVSPATRLAALQEYHASSCPYCRHNDQDHSMVFGEGDPNASLMFIGESPGTEEERLGRPFAGRAGAKLDEMIKAMGLRREAVYITNALKSRPPGVRPSERGDFECCGAFLAAQVRIISPDAIVALGGPASSSSWVPWNLSLRGM